MPVAGCGVRRAGVTQRRYRCEQLPRNTVMGPFELEPRFGDPTCPPAVLGLATCATATRSTPSSGCWRRYAGRSATWNFVDPSQLPLDFGDDLPDWPELVANTTPLEKGQNLAADDGTWKVGRRLDDGHLFVSAHGRTPWSTQLRDEDVVHVDTARGYLVIETKGHREHWIDNWFDKPHHSPARDFDDGVILLVRITSNTGTSRHWAPDPGITVLGFVETDDDPAGVPPPSSGRVGPDTGSR